MYMLRKALYGLRHSGREWSTELNQCLLKHRYQRSLAESCLCYKFENEKIILVLVYVDDILVATNDEQRKVKLLEDLDAEYGIKDQVYLNSTVSWCGNGTN